MSRPPAPLPSALGGEFSCSAASAIGISAKRMRARDLETPFRGVRRRVPPAGDGAATDAADHTPLAADRALERRVRADARAYALIMGPGSFFCGRTAAVLFGIGIGHGDELEVGVIAPARAPRRRGIRGRQWAPSHVEVTEVAGLRVSTPASTWAMLARESDVAELVRAGDGFVRVPRGPGRHPMPLDRLATPEELASAASAGRRVGAARLAEALTLIRVGSMSPLETDCRLVLTAAGLPEPVLDVEIRDRAGRLVGIADAAWPDYRVLAEVEGDHHRTSRRQWVRDIERHAALTALGFDVVRLTSAHIRHPRPAAVSLVGDALRRRGWSPQA
ncbi:hypothetical protein [Microbacterium oleivorans]|uniref:DUF559 domain-containing protein n=1 Tax=Microbacterium oleivorans TaxID=273677 RepID=A0A7D5IWZ7_9MICO|nr:hypothetical protein [Microbacterium oleivorans]QLD12342.1 hypothetical protein HW566_11475 [Microbacterium oleivorans]